MRLPRLRQKKKRWQTQLSVGGVYNLMSMSPEPPERLAEILMEILALSKPEQTSESEFARGSDSIESSDAHCVKEQSERADEGDNNRKNVA